MALVDELKRAKLFPTMCGAEMVAPCPMGLQRVSNETLLIMRLTGESLHTRLSYLARSFFGPLCS